ncbi:hypothetical protein SLEP1_g38647 [Rubroshorea leprosula]|uniref:Uncharacterized protein n=1 Tax=Rubroshorea leprosula TaxID=152421 RepID=A0AAV5KY12_9ROSI|nr:hypothetical protein SLEP1_g38647 [Rubroshorea leprosula]
MRGIKHAPGLEQSPECMVRSKLTIRNDLFCHRTSSVLNGIQPFLYAFPVVSDPRGHRHRILHDLKRNRAEEERRNIDFFHQNKINFQNHKKPR